MNEGLKRFAGAAALAGSVTFAGATTPAPPPAEFAVVSTFAGNGRVGFDDGAAASASFAMPTALARDSAGNVYVCDYASERIRKIAPDGAVTTVAGGGAFGAGGLYVPGDRVNGPGTSARFYSPFGIAVDSDRTIYVSDAGDHVVRKIQNGVVSTYAGNWDTAGNALGPKTGGALFTKPVALAVDSQHDLYVADVAIGVREITADGNVIEPPFSKALDRPSGIALYERGGVTNIVVADAKGLVLYDARRTIRRISRESLAVDGFKPLGYPLGVAMLGPATVAFTDPRTDQIRIWAGGEERVIAGETVDDPEHFGGGYRDGGGEHAKFDGPMGILALPDGSLLVADAGNRRIRKLSPVDLRYAIDPAYGELPAFDPGAYHVVIAGDSFVDWDMDRPHSIAGVLESRLNALPGHARVQVVAIRSAGWQMGPEKDYLQSVAADFPIDYLVLLEDSSAMTGSYQAPPDPPRDWFVSEAARDLRAMGATLSHPGNAVVAVHPYPWEISPAQTLWHRFFEKTDQEWMFPVDSFHAELVRAGRDSGLPVIDLWSDFERAEKQPDREPLFATIEPHFAAAGNRVTADAIAQFLTGDARWRAVLAEPPR